MFAKNLATGATPEYTGVMFTPVSQHRQPSTPATAAKAGSVRSATMAVDTANTMDLSARTKDDAKLHLPIEKLIADCSLLRSTILPDYMAAY